MTRNEIQRHALSLPEQERRELAETLWESVDIPDWHKALIDERLAAHEANPDEVVPWAEVERELIAR